MLEIPLNLLALLMTIMIILLIQRVVGDPQINLLIKSCSEYNATNLSNFYQNFNATFADLGNQSRSKNFATAQHAIADPTGELEPVYGLFQCRNYLSNADCAACFTAAFAKIKNCSAEANIGGRVIYDGCFLRYEYYGFYNDTIVPANSMICGTQQNANGGDNAFSGAAQQVLKDLQIATPKIKGFFAATKTQIPGGGAIYAIAQCAQTVSETGCLDCLTDGCDKIQSCLPNTNGRAFGAGCFIRYSQTPFFPHNQTIDITPYLNQGGSNKTRPHIGVVIGAVVLLLVVLFALFVWLARNNKLTRFLRGDMAGAVELKGPVIYRYKELKFATKNFSHENKLGEGGFGDVFKGALNNGKLVAVKKLNLGQSKQMDESFQSEVKLLSNVHHRNVVRLLGCCNKGHEKILVYEYMINRSLDIFLFGKNKGSLNWKQRCDIILGTAKGLAFLHEDFHVCIIHRDIKTNNILLDNDLQPKIADFGLARLLPDDKTHLSTKFAGTMGYIAPEYAIHGQLSEKADTYSYGVVVLEIISGQKSSELREDADGEFLLQRAWKLYEKDMHLELMDRTLDPEDYDAEQVKKIIEIALLCTQPLPATRPTMSEVVVLLKSKDLLMGQMKPNMPVFVQSNSRSRPDTSTSTGFSASNATASTSALLAR